MPEKLTSRQRSILEYIRHSIQDNGRSPTIREMCHKFKISSTNGIRDHLKALINKGYLEKDSMISRGIRLVERAVTHAVTLPLVGSAPAGYPLTAIENYEGEIALDTSFLPSGESFTLNVRGDSMKNAGIVDGDIVIVRKQEKAEVGEIVVAVIDNEATIKRFFYEESSDKKSSHTTIRLQPENASYDPIIVNTDKSDFYIAGKVVGLLRRIR